MATGQTPDFRALFESAPGLYLVLSPDLKIIAVTDAYLRATMTKREAVLGKGLFEVFPDNPDDPKASGVRNLAASLQQVIKSKSPDTMAVQKYDIRKPESEGGAYEERHWSPHNAPVLDARGNVAYLIHRVEDVTEFVRLKEKGAATQELESRSIRMEAEILQRAQEVQEANQKLALANEQLARMHEEVRAHDLAKHQAELLARESIFHAAIEASLDSFIMMKAIRDEQGKVIDFKVEQVNARMLRLIGYSREQAVGKPMSELFPFLHEQGFMKEYIQVLETRVPSLREFPMASEHVHAAWLFHQVVPVGDGVAIFARDISEQKKLEDQFRQAQKMESVGRLAGGVAHDFNNLLTIILGYAELATSKLVPGENKLLDAALRNILTAGGRAAELTGQLLAFARKQVIELRVIDLNLVITEAQKILTRVLGEDIEFANKKDKALWNCKADPGQITQVLINLSINARDAMPKGGRLTIETSNTALDENYCRSHAEVTPGEYVLLAVSDTGHGMDAETKSHLFEPFFTTKAMGKGTGLGLATCYGIVRQNGGHIWYYSEVGIGSTFKVYLPRVHEAQSQAQKAATPIVAKGSEIILLVEDEPMVRDFAALTLRSHGYEVRHAPGGKEALEKSEEPGGQVDLLVTDVVMPGMSGKELAEKLRAKWPTLKVLFTSGYTANVIENHGVLEAGMHFLPKPFTPTELARKVREVLDGNP